MTLRWILAAALVVASCGDRAEPKRVRLAVTTSTENSGLLRDILPPFEKATGIEVQVIAVGTGKALELGRRGDADLVLVHARELEDAFVAEGAGVDRRDLMYNDFVVAGPPADPAGVRDVKDAADAFRRIRAARARFVSRGDQSGTHTRELAIWEAAGGVPRGEDCYLEAGQGMGSCLTIADEKEAYILSDRGTFYAYQKKDIDLAILVEGDPALRNPYGAILVNPARHPRLHAEEARRLLDYLVSPACQRRIGDFQVDGKILFHPMAGG